MTKVVEERDRVVIRFAGDSGDGMQLAGSRFTDATALVGNDLATGTLVRVLPRFTTMRGSLYLLYPAARHVPRKITAFRDFVLTWLRAHPLGKAR